MPATPRILTTIFFVVVPPEPLEELEELVAALVVAVALIAADTPWPLKRFHPEIIRRAGRKTGCTVSGGIGGQGCGGAHRLRIGGIAVHIVALLGIIICTGFVRPGQIDTGRTGGLGRQIGGRCWNIGGGTRAAQWVQRQRAGATSVA